MIRNWLRVGFFSFVFCVASCCAAVANAETLALVGGSVYPSPDAAPFADAVVVTSGDAITAIGSRGEPCSATHDRLQRLLMRFFKL